MSFDQKRKRQDDISRIAKNMQVHASCDFGNASFAYGLNTERAAFLAARDVVSNKNQIVGLQPTGIGISR